MWASRAGFGILMAGLLAAVLTVGGCDMAPMGTNGSRFAHTDSGSADQSVAAQFDAAVEMVVQARYEEAADKFVGLLPRLAGDPPRAAEGAFWLGYCRQKQGRAAEAIVLYQQVVADYPDTPAARQAARRLAAMRQ
jgi:tetratricopeptide (TPR) repeat protein